MIRFLASILCWVLFASVAQAQVLACNNPGTGTCVYTDAGRVSNTLPTNLGSVNLQLQGYSINALTTGANPNTIGASSGVDNSVAINTALAFTVPGSSSLANVYLPAGHYHVTHKINLQPGQCIIGDGFQSTKIDIDMDFDPTALGVVVVSPRSVADDVRPCIKGVHFYFHLPNDIAATASSATAGATSITVSGANGTITTGMYVADYTATSSNPIPVGSGAIATTVNSVAGGTIGLSQGIAFNLNPGDSIHFAQPRSGFSALGTCNTSIPGGSPCMYPYAIYNDITSTGSQLADYDQILIAPAWNGIYQKGSTFHFGLVWVGAFNIGMSISRSFNFSAIDNYQGWDFDIGNNSGVNTPWLALSNVYYDGSVIDANIADTNGLNIDNFQSWAGKVNITSNNGWISFGNLQLDGDYANMVVTDCAWIQIANFYSTKSSLSVGSPLTFTPATSTCRLTINNSRFGHSAAGYSAVTMNNGRLQLLGGNFDSGVSSSSPSPMIAQSGGILTLSGLNLGANSPGTGFTYVSQTGGAIHAANINFFTTPNGGGSTSFSLISNGDNVVTDIALHGWGFTAPASGLYFVANNVYNNSLRLAGSSQADLQLYNAAAGTDQKYWSVENSASNNFVIRSANDAFSASAAWIVLNRGSGYALNNMTFNAPFVETGTSAPALSNGNAGVYASPTNGGTYSGQGSTYDVVFANNAAAIALAVPTGTTNVSTLGELDTAASVTGNAGLNVPNGVAPTSPITGDIWTTSAVGGFFFRTNSVNYQTAVVNGVNVYTAGEAIDGTAPSSCTSTGTGTGNSCSFSGGSNNTVGKIIITTGTTPSSSGSFTVNLATNMLGSNSPVCTYTLNDANTVWASTATVHDTTANTTTYGGNWYNGGANLTASVNYVINYRCTGK